MLPAVENGSGRKFAVHDLVTRMAANRSVKVSTGSILRCQIFAPRRIRQSFLLCVWRIGDAVTPVQILLKLAM